MTSTMLRPQDIQPPAAEPPRSPRWERPALIALLVLTGVLYLWGLSRNGWANAFYSAAVQAGSESWKAFFFGSSDAANSITVDKTPASLWVMALSARIFGVNSWSILVPQALMGVATAGLLFATVKRWFGPAAGLIAGAVFALTPVAVLMFRFNNPDALLVLLMVAGAYATVRAIEQGSTKWLVLAGVFVGFGFLAKMLQALLVVPAFALAFLLFAPGSWWRRLGQLLLAGLAIVVSAGWYIAIVELVPDSMRPYIGGSQNNSLLELTLGYNGLGRLNGTQVGSVGGGGGWGETGLLRMFDASQGGQISWLLPAALILLVAGLVLAGRRGWQTAGLTLWGSWLLITGLVFSLMQGIFHAYYTVALAPAIAAAVGMGTAVVWRFIRTGTETLPAETLPINSTMPIAGSQPMGWRKPFATLALAAAIAVTAWWSYHLLSQSPDFVPWLRWLILIGGLVTAIGIVISTRLSVRLALVTAVAALTIGLAGPAAYAVQTASESHTGSIPSAGPAVSGGGGPGGPGRGMRGGFPGGGRAPGNANGNGQPPPGFGQNQAGGGAQNGGMTRGGMRGGGGGGMGGLLDAATVSDELKSLLESNADQYTWVAAAVGSQNASGYQLATGNPVMAVGGFNGSDPSPTLAQFQQYVAEGKIHYFIGGGGFGGGGGGRGGNSGGSNASSQIAEWVASTYEAQTVDGVTVYDLTQ